MLTPEPVWKILLGNFLSRFILNILTIIPIFFVVVHSFNITGIPLSRIFDAQFDGIALLNFVFLPVLSYFCAKAIVMSYFYDGKKRRLLTALVTVLTHMVVNLLNFALIPFGTFYSQGIFFFIFIRSGANIGTVLAIVILIVQLTLLFLVTNRLIERRTNI